MQHHWHQRIAIITIREGMMCADVFSRTPDESDLKVIAFKPMFYSGRWNATLVSTLSDWARHEHGAQQVVVIDEFFRAEEKADQARRAQT